MADNKDKGKQEGKVTVLQPPAPPTEVQIFGTGDAQAQINKATAIATAVAKIIKSKKLYKNIQGHDYVFCEGWTTMAAMIGLFPHIVEVREDRDRGAYIAVCELRTMKGSLVSRAEAECSRQEAKKAENEHYAIRSMAQTRAVSKACRIALSWIMVLAGYKPTPAEEMEGVQGKEGAPPAKAPPKPPPKPVDLKPLQLKKINMLEEKLKKISPKHTPTTLNEIKAEGCKDKVKADCKKMTDEERGSWIHWLEKKITEEEEENKMQRPPV